LAAVPGGPIESASGFGATFSASLGHFIKTEFPGRVQILPERYDEYFVSYEGTSKWRKELPVLISAG
jgi:hypothetical protein